MSRILRLRKRMASRARMEARSGCVVRRVRRGVRWVWAVLRRPKVVVRKVRRGETRVGGRRLWRRAP